MAAVAVCFLASATASGAEPELTMRVLNDASEAPAVLAEAVEAADASAKRSEDDGDRRAGRQRRAAAGEGAPRGAESSELGAKVELDTVVDREQESESEIEDFDVPEDIDYELLTNG